MKLIEKINADIIVAYKARDAEAKTILGLLKGTATKVNKVPADGEVVAVAKSMIKTHTKSMAEHNAPTLTDGEKSILEGFIPSIMDETTLTTIIEYFIKEEGLTGPQDMGKVMGHLKSTQDGQYDGKMASNIVKSTLASLV